MVIETKFNIGDVVYAYGKNCNSNLYLENEVVRLKIWNILIDVVEAFTGRAYYTTDYTGLHKTGCFSGLQEMHLYRTEDELLASENKESV
jgi:hypothetical protein